MKIPLYCITHELGSGTKHIQTRKFPFLHPKFKIDKLIITTIFLVYQKFFSLNHFYKISGERDLIQLKLIVDNSLVFTKKRSF